MAEFTSHAHGTPSWADLMSPDVDAAKAFYGGLFGWDTEDQLDDNGNRVYVMCRLGGKATAGIGQMPPTMPAGMPAAWNTYVSVDDVAATAAKVTDAGGQVMMPPMEVFDSGEMAVFADTTGAAFSVWRAKEHIGAEVGNIANTMSWNELTTSDTEAAKTFYTSVFGWSYESQDMGPMGTYTLIAGGESGLGGIMPRPPMIPAEVPDHWMVYFTVADLAATCDKAQQLGGAMVVEPMEIPGIGNFAVLADAHGGSFSCLQPAAEG